MNTLLKIVFACALLLGVPQCLHAAAAPKDKPLVPDFTKRGTRDETHDWTLGPTGARGWVWAWRQQTTDARQILVTEIAAGSPADGVLQKDDVILGMNGRLFGDDARVTFAKAITEAERVNGVLNLVRWRNGQTQNVTVRLPVLGAYAATAPYDCPKSKRIFEQGCAAIAKAGFKNKRGDGIRIEIANALRALALLASGRAEYRPLVAEYAATVSVCTPNQGGHKSWDYGYETLFLAEYATATKDASVMPGLTRLATDIASGASAVGTWGHTFARPEGNLNGYGCMNQPGIVLTMAMVVAREAGVKSPQLDLAIARSARFLRWFAGKGAIPYGDHAPWPDHDDNGKCSSAAILFDLLGEREPAAFFARMATAAHAERESGHTGNFFNVLWALPGVARCGPLATGAYLRETAWYYDLARGWDVRFAHQGLPGARRENYSDWDCTGAYMLAYALPLRSLVITGRKPSVVPPLTPAEVANVIGSGNWNWWNGLETFYDPCRTQDLYGGLSSWSPTVRERCAKALAKKSDAAVPTLIQMLDAKDKETRYGACVALRYLGTKANAAAPKLRTLLASSDPWQRALAAEAIVEMSESVRKAAIPDLLRVVIRRDDPDDPRRCVMGPLTEVLFKPGPGRRTPDSILRNSLDAVDAPNRPLLIAAIRDVLHSEDGRIRGGVGKIYPLLAPKELANLMPDIVEAIRKPAPSGEMFAYDIRMAGLELLAKLRIREGMDLCVDILNEHRWGRDFARAAKALQLYGGAAKAVLPRLRHETRAIAEQEGKNKNCPAILTRLIADIEADASPKPVRGLAEFIKNPSAPSSD